MKRVFCQSKLVSLLICGVIWINAHINGHDRAKAHENPFVADRPVLGIGWVIWTSPGD